MTDWSPVPWQMALSFSINAPANLLRDLVRVLWDKHVYPNCSMENADKCIRIGMGIEIFVFLLGVAFIWYIVALEIKATRRGTITMAHLGTPARVVVDAGLVAAGSVFLILFVENWKSLHLIMAPWYGAGIFCYLAWALFIVVSYGRDLIRCISRSR
jgi:hypothetical protein